MTDPSDRKTPAEGDEDWAAIWSAVKVAKVLKVFTPLASLVMNWKAALAGAAAAVFLGGPQFVERISKLLSGVFGQ